MWCNHTDATIVLTFHLLRTRSSGRAFLFLRDCIKEPLDAVVVMSVKCRVLLLLLLLLLLLHCSTVGT